MKELFEDAELDKARNSASPIKKHHELQLIARFWGQEIRHFLIRRHSVRSAYLISKILIYAIFTQRLSVLLIGRDTFFAQIIHHFLASHLCPDSVEYPL
jgi:hypothetical protein